jgi:integrase
MNVGAEYRADLNLVFCYPDGGFIRPDTITKAVRRIARKEGLTGVSLPTLRHSHGSQLLSAGVPFRLCPNGSGTPTSTLQPLCTRMR